MKKVKVRKVEKVASAKIGRFNKNGVKLGPGEEKSFVYLTLYGLDVEVIRPTGIKKMRNPDILMMGSIWEVKTPVSSNRNTIKNRFREASKQATNVVFDLRFIKENVAGAETQIIEMFEGNGKVRRMMIVRKGGGLLDFYK